MIRTLCCTLILTLLLFACAGSAPKTAAEKAIRLNELYEGYKAEFPGVKECTIKDLLALREKGAPVVVDVRTPAEWEISMPTKRSTPTGPRCSTAPQDRKALLLGGDPFVQREAIPASPPPTTVPTGKPVGEAIWQPPGPVQHPHQRSVAHLFLLAARLDMIWNQRRINWPDDWNAKYPCSRRRATGI